MAFRKAPDYVDLVFGCIIVKVNKFISDPLAGADFRMGYWSSAIPEMMKLGYAKAHRGYPDRMPMCVLIGEQDVCAINDFSRRSDESIRRELSAAACLLPKIHTYPKCRHELFLELNTEEKKLVVSHPTRVYRPGW